MEAGSLPVIRIADAGELADVRHLIEELGVEWVAEAESPKRPTALWIGTPGRLMAAGEACAQAGFRIVVVDKMTRTLERQLERQRPDFLVSRPFHPAALRLLILHSLYVGPERRASARIAISAIVRFRTNLLSHAATLVEISRGGCRLIGRSLPAQGERVTLMLPQQLTGSSGLSLAGRVVSADSAGGYEPGEQACSIAFAALDKEQASGLRAMLERHALGSGSLVLRSGPRKRAAKALGEPRLATPPGPATAPPAAAKPAPVAPSSDASERRRATRHPYPRPVLAAGAGAARILIGRDLSSGGMRVAPGANLLVGDTFKLVLYGPAGHPPLVLRAVVSRDDGSEGCVLLFEDLTPKTVAEIAEWTTLLPTFAGSTEGATPALHSIVSEVIDGVEGSE